MPWLLSYCRVWIVWIRNATGLFPSYERNIDTLIDKLENSASELLKQAQMYHLELEKNLSEESSLFTLKIVKK